MYFCTVLTLLVLLVVDQSFAGESCNTCRGTDCLKRDILQLDCTKFVPALPFESQLLINNKEGDQKYGCLELEYYIDQHVDRIQQCILTTDLQSFCETLEYSLKIKNCNVKSTDKIRNVRSLSNIEASMDELQSVNGALFDTNQELEEGSGDSTSTPSPPETTTAHASSIHLISLASFLGVLATLLL